MKSPWTRKNPLLSMYLSGANAVAGAVRSRGTAELRRQAATLMNQGARQIAGLWGDLLAGPPAKKRRRKPRRG